MTTQSKIGSADFAQILAKTRDAAAGGLGALSTGEALAAALVLNRPDWLASMNYTIAEAIERIGPEWIRLIPAAAKQFNRDSEETAYQAAEKARQAQLAEFTARRQADDKIIECSATFITSGSAPGYRDLYLTFDLKPIGVEPPQIMRAQLRVLPEDGETVVREITDVHRLAWRKGPPIDAKAGEQRPRWIDGR
jgi:hypothetical protein